GSVQKRFAADALQLASLLPKETLGVDPLVDRVAEIEPSGQLDAAEKRAETGMSQPPVFIGDAAFVPVVGRANVKSRQPTDGGQIILGDSLANAGTSQRHLGVLILREAKNGLQIDCQGLRRGGRGPIRGRLHFGKS